MSLIHRCDRCKAEDDYTTEYSEVNVGKTKISWQAHFNAPSQPERFGGMDLCLGCHKKLVALIEKWFKEKA